jgi:hypothetical protein
LRRVGSAERRARVRVLSAMEEGENTRKPLMQNRIWARGACEKVRRFFNSQSQNDFLFAYKS